MLRPYKTVFFVGAWHAKPSPGQPYGTQISRASDFAVALHKDTQNAFAQARVCYYCAVLPRASEPRSARAVILGPTPL
jgi:hypothetical protein